MDYSASELRRWAAHCEEMAASAVTITERNKLMRKAESLRELADSDDWLEGRQANRPECSDRAAERESIIRSLAAE